MPTPQCRHGCKSTLRSCRRYVPSQVARSRYSGRALTPTPLPLPPERGIVCARCKPQQPSPLALCREHHRPGSRAQVLLLCLLATVTTSGESAGWEVAGARDGTCLFVLGFCE